MKDDTTISGHAKPQGRKTIEVDWDYYDSLLGDSDLSDAEKRQTLEALWEIVVAFVSLGHSFQPYENSCGKGQNGSERFTAIAADVVGLDRTPKVENSDGTAEQSLLRAERSPE